jgi:hypothetical protein
MTLHQALLFLDQIRVQAEINEPKKSCNST